MSREGQPYRVIGPDGEPIGTAVLPADEQDDRIVEAERSTVWAYEVDELGVQDVVRYRVGG